MLSVRALFLMRTLLRSVKIRFCVITTISFAAGTDLLGYIQINIKNKQTGIYQFSGLNILCITNAR